MKFKLKRITAHIIDIVISLIVGLLVMGALVVVASNFADGLNINLTKYSSYIGAGAFVVGYILVNSFSLKKHQASVGKRILGLKIVGTSNVLVLMMRTVAPILISYIAVLLSVLTLINYLVGFGPRNKCGHDYLFKTEVVNS